MSDTIAAISTAMGEAGIGIVRMTGSQAIQIGQSVFIGKAAENENRKLMYGHIYDEDKLIDEVLISFMKGPHTYTREDMVEIYCHGGIVPVRKILELLLKSGARLAEAGEYTKRAFLNGRLDLSQAEAVIDIIKSKTDKSYEVSLDQLEGSLTNKIKEIREILLGMVAHIEVSIDFPDEDAEVQTLDELEKNALEVKEKISSLLATSDRGRILRDGLNTVILGKPNVGKSSLLNALLGQQRAIVHEIPGTTRDLLEGMLVLEGFTLRLIDTAGIHGTVDPVEKIGVERSQAAARQARLLLMVFDGSSPLGEEDERIIDLIKPDQKIIFIVNKTDLGTVDDYKRLTHRFPDIPLVYTAITRNEGLTELEETLVGLLEKGTAVEDIDPILVSERHIEIISIALESIRRAREMWGREPLEMVSLEIRNAWEKLGELTGETASEELLDHIFQEFCIGK